MPKMRSHSGSKNVLKLPVPVVIRHQAGASHLAPGKTQKQTRQLRKNFCIKS